MQAGWRVGVTIDVQDNHMLLPTRTVGMKEPPCDVIVIHTSQRPKYTPRQTHRHTPPYKKLLPQLLPQQ